MNMIPDDLVYREALVIALNILTSENATKNYEIPLSLKLSMFLKKNSTLTFFL